MPTAGFLSVSCFLVSTLSKITEASNKGAVGIARDDGVSAADTDVVAGAGTTAGAAGAAGTGTTVGAAGVGAAGGTGAVTGAATD